MWKGLKSWINISDKEPSEVEENAAVATYRSFPCKEPLRWPTACWATPMSCATTPTGNRGLWVGPTPSRCGAPTLRVLSSSTLGHCRQSRWGRDESAYMGKPETITEGVPRSLRMLARFVTRP